MLILRVFLKITCTTYIRFTVVREVFIDDKRQGSCGGWRDQSCFHDKALRILCGQSCFVK